MVNENIELRKFGLNELKIICDLVVKDID